MEHLKLPLLQRTAIIDATSLVVERQDGEPESREMEISFSSEEPYERFFGIEILGHKKGEVDLSRLKSGRAPLLVDHRANVDNQIGVVTKVWLKDGTARAIVRFGKGSKANEIFDRVKDGELSSVSVGYRVNRMRLEEEDDDKSTFRVVDWTPHEVSVVSVPADTTVGFGRSESEAGMADVEIIQREKTMTPEELAAKAAEDKAAADAAARAAVLASQQAQPQGISEEEAEKRAKDAMRAERKRIEEITAYGAKFNMRDKAEEAIESGISIDQFRHVVIDALGSQAEEVMAAKAEIGLTTKEKKKFSFVKALAALAFASTPTGAALAEAAAFELECSRAAEQKYEKTAQGVLVPVDILRTPYNVLSAEQRDLTVGTATAGGHTVSTDLLAASFIDILRNRAVVMRLGARMMMDLEGNIAIPRQTGAATAYWINEGASLTESQQAFDQVTMAPNTVGAYNDISRRLLIQSSIDIEGFMRGDIARVIALEIDRTALYGTGGSQPTGVANTTGINTGTADFAAADPTFAEVVDCESVVAADNADVGTLAYAVDALMRGAFKTTEKASGTAQFIWEQGNTVNGYRCEVSNQVVDGDVFFGNWDDLFLGFWSGLDLLIDPYTGGPAGTVRVIAHQDMDVAVRHPESFCLNNDGV